MQLMGKSCHHMSLNKAMGSVVKKKWPLDKMCNNETPSKHRMPVGGIASLRKTIVSIETVTKQNTSVARLSTFGNGILIKSCICAINVKNMVQ